MVLNSLGKEKLPSPQTSQCLFTTRPSTACLACRIFVYGHVLTINPTLKIVIPVPQTLSLANSTHRGDQTNKIRDDVGRGGFSQSV